MPRHRRPKTPEEEAHRVQAHLAETRALLAMIEEPAPKPAPIVSPPPVRWSTRGRVLHLPPRLVRRRLGGVELHVVDVMTKKLHTVLYAASGRMVIESRTSWRRHDEEHTVHQEAGGWCRSCRSDQCEAVKLAADLLLTVMPWPVGQEETSTDA